MEEFFKEYEITEELAEETKRRYEIYLANATEEPKLTLEEYFYSLFELGLLYNEIEEKENKILKIKKRLGSISEEDYKILGL